MSKNAEPSRGDDLLASETISELRNWIEAFAPRAKRAVSLVDRLAFLLSEASAARGLPPISETSEEKPLMKWSELAGEPATSQACPKDGLRYYIVDGTKYWAACISEGTTYKLARTLTDTCGTANEARRVCEQHWFCYDAVPAPATPAPAGDEAQQAVENLQRCALLSYPDHQNGKYQAEQIIRKAIDNALSASRREVAEITKDRDQLADAKEGLGMAVESLREQVTEITRERDEAQEKSELFRLFNQVWWETMEQGFGVTRAELGGAADIKLKIELLRAQLATVIEQLKERETELANAFEVTRQLEANISNLTESVRQIGEHSNLALDTVTEQLQAAETQITYDTECIERITKAGMQAELDLDEARKQLQAAVAEEDKWDAALTIARQERDSAESRARAAEAALAAIRGMWAILPTNDMIHYEDCVCFQCSVRKVLSDGPGESILTELSEVRKDLQQVTAKYLLATSPTKPI